MYEWKIVNVYLTVILTLEEFFALKHIAVLIQNCITDNLKPGYWLFQVNWNTAFCFF